MSEDTKPSAEELLEGYPVDRYGKDDARWGYREVQVYKHAGKHWAVPVYVITGDEGGIEAEGEPCEVQKVEVTSYEWREVTHD